jgi:hypoxanthine phosphoribosyltransferase
MVDSATEILLPKEDILRRVAELAAMIDRDYAGMELLVIGVLKGAFIFLADLIRALHIPSSVDFVMISSYGSGRESSGSVVIKKDIDALIAGRDILIVEDILDTGITLSGLVDIMKKRNPASLRVCVLLDKPSRRTIPFTADYVGFSIPDAFVVGYGLDCNEKYRHLPDVRIFRDPESSYA